MDSMSSADVSPDGAKVERDHARDGVTTYTVSHSQRHRTIHAWRREPYGEGKRNRFTRKILTFNVNCHISKELGKRILVW